jgi:hypothetical protein
VSGELKETHGPSLVYISIRNNRDGSKNLCIAEIGSDDSDGFIASTENMVIERMAPREPIFGFDSADIIEKKSKDLVKKRWEYWIKPQRVPQFDSNEVDEYPVLHQTGMLSVEMDLRGGTHIGDVGIQIACDGRIWLCYDGGAYIRFKPLTAEQLEIIK